ncbi:glycosyltransferase family 39 protein [Nodosilinea sp. LEGE 07088]|uniref:ArnT family glycosyltransferase n=1 Tax=Nodosilinea sp. LEGE 07088 TaxID=2777968 RepID=UPI00187E7BA5|nr:glycosyltransferase family 39 protein [Nodosilinea sp. LEGE 07088]MBE9140846.1 glycosyltransferase family 39 protein [Nodosilinea sp. LEGE 07088]
MAFDSNSLTSPRAALTSGWQTVQQSIRRYPMAALLTLALALRTYHLRSPIIGVHAWRQSDTAAMARNFSENGFQFLYPQIDWGGSSPGFAETEFPLYPYAVALIYRLLGVAEAYGRLLSIFCALIGIYFLYRLVALVLDRPIALWSAGCYAILPLNVFYSRTFQPESMVLAASIIGLYGFVHWQRQQQDRSLLLSAVFVTLACLIKVLPIIYVGLPLLFLAILQFKGRLFFQWRLWLYAAVVIGATALWYWHAHQIFLETGLSFGFWGNSNRYGWGDLTVWQFWGDIILRLAVRHFAVFGFILFCIGLFQPRHAPQEYLFEVGLVAVLITCMVAPTSSYIHEYYQLPFMIYAAPFMGKAWVNLMAGGALLTKRLLIAGCSLMIVTGTVIYGIDYMAREIPERSAVYHLAGVVRQTTPADARVVSVTGGDPNLLYLSHRKGWLISPAEVTPDVMQALSAAGAGYLVGSYEVVESYAPFTDDAQKAQINALVSEQLEAIVNDDRVYVAPIP